jgi:hypothetical protein
MEARLLYTAAMLNADAIGKCKTIRHLGRYFGLSDAETSAAITQLESENAISVVTEQIPIAMTADGGYVMDYRTDALLNDFSSPIEHDRLSPESWTGLREIVFERDNYTCQYCGYFGDELECDHVHPISRGGTNELGNLITSCGPCNKSKRDKLLFEWRGRK